MFTSRRSLLGPVIVALVICNFGSVAKAQLRTAHDRIDELEQRFDQSLELQERVAGHWQTLEESLAASHRETEKLKADLAAQKAEILQQKAALARQTDAFDKQQGQLASAARQLQEQRTAVLWLSENNRQLQQRLTAAEYQRRTSDKAARLAAYERFAYSYGRPSTDSSSTPPATTENRARAYHLPTSPISRIGTSYHSPY